jgi:hypothetical protein
LLGSSGYEMRGLSEHMRVFNWPVHTRMIAGPVA